MNGLLDRKDRLILHHLCQHGKVTDRLLELVSKTTTYRRIEKLLKMGLLTRGEEGYKLTPAGEKALLGQNEGLAGTWPHLAAIPTAYHLAMAELIIAAVSARISGLFSEHLPSFLLVGPTMAWKTSLARFLCQAFGLDPARHIIDLSTETSRSLWLRRNAKGQVIYKREILSAPFVTFDEYGLADKQVRVAVGHFIAGRLKVPVENEVLEFRVTPLLTANPLKEEGNVKSRTGFSEPQIRRTVICDLCAVSLPDLAVEGEEILERERQAAPFPLRPAKERLVSLRRKIVQLMRKLIRPDAQSLVDTEMLRILCCGMAAYMEPRQALWRVMLDYCTVVETLGWTVENWRELLAQENIEPSNNILEEETMGQETQGIKRYVTFVEVETGKNAEEALQVLVDLIKALRACGLTLEDARRLGEVMSHAAAQRISPQRLQQHLKLERILQEHDIPLETLVEVVGQLQKQGLLEAERFKALDCLVRLMRRHRVDLRVLREVVGLFAAAEKHGLCQNFLTEVVKFGGMLQRQGLDVLKGFENLVHAAYDRTALEDEVKGLRDTSKALRAEVSELQQKAEKLREKVDGLTELCREKMEKVFELCDSVLDLAKEVKRMSARRRRLVAEVEHLQGVLMSWHAYAQ